jgi:hypothetical protein
MNSMLYKYIRISALVLFILGVVFLLVNIFFRSSVSVIVTYEGFNPKTTEVLVDGDLVVPEGPEANTYKANLRPGGHSVAVFGPTIKPNTIDFSTSILESKEVLVDNIEVLSAKQIAEDIYEIEPNSELSVFNARLFFNNSWIAFTVNDPTGNGAVVVASYNTVSKSWEIIGDGTDIDFSTNSFNEVPSDLKEYVNGL